MDRHEQLTALLRDVEDGIADAQRLLPEQPVTEVWQGVDNLFGAVRDLGTIARLLIHAPDAPAPHPTPGYTLGRLIREVRRRAKLTQAELGARLSPPRSHAAISDIEADKTHLGLDQLDRLATALGLPLLIDVTLGDITVRVVAPTGAGGQG